KQPKMMVYGNDYPTRDGSCIRDYIHVSDISHAHTLAIKAALEGRLKSSCEAFNLGTGKGVSVLELIHAFEETTGCKLNYEIGPRRQGDVIEIYANSEKAREELGWVPEADVKEMMATAWKWEKYLDLHKNA